MNMSEEEALELGEIVICPACDGEAVGQDEDGWHCCPKCRGTGYLPGCPSCCGNEDNMPCGDCGDTGIKGGTDE